MIVWGGSNGFNLLNNSGAYNASTDHWRTIAITNAPTERYGHTAIWTGSEMIVWGGNAMKTASSIPEVDIILTRIPG